MNLSKKIIIILDAERTLAEQIAKNTSGVSGVENKLEVIAK